MAVMTAEQREETLARLMRDPEASVETVAVTKAELRGAVAAIDQYLHDNAAAINAAIPQPARAALTARQKARLMVAVIERRYRLGV